MDRFRNRALEIVDEIKPNPEETIIRICTGYVNIKAKDALRDRDFAVVEVYEIGEPLQSLLEAQHKLYINELVGADVYYEPKGMSEGDVGRRFYKAVNFARTNNKMHLVKSGWKHFQRRGM